MCACVCLTHWLDKTTHQSTSWCTLRIMAFFICSCVLLSTLSVIIHLLFPPSLSFILSVFYFCLYFSKPSFVIWSFSFPLFESLSSFSPHLFFKTLVGFIYFLLMCFSFTLTQNITQLHCFYCEVFSHIFLFIYSLTRLLLSYILFISLS